MIPPTLTVIEDRDDEPFGICDHPDGIRAGVAAAAQDIRRRYDQHAVEAARQVEAWLNGEEAS